MPVERVANISYGDAGGRNLLDVHRNRSHPPGGPVLIHVHGGSYVGGRKSTQSLPLLYRLASQGWVCISANYRLRPAVQHPDHLIDLKKVIAWVRAHGHEYDADPAMVFVSGYGRAALSAPVAHVRADAPPFFIAHGNQHTFDLFSSVRFEAVVDGVEAFTAWVRTLASEQAH